MPAIGRHRGHSRERRDATARSTIQASAHRHAGLRAAVGIQQATGRRRRSHRQGSCPRSPRSASCAARVNDEHQAASDQPVRLGVAGADAEKICRWPVAGVQQEAQQLVAALHETALQHLADAQVEFGEIVDADQVLPPPLAGRVKGSVSRLLCSPTRARRRRPWPAASVGAGRRGVLLASIMASDLLRVDAGEQRAVKAGCCDR